MITSLYHMEFHIFYVVNAGKNHAKKSKILICFPCQIFFAEHAEKM